MSSQIKTHRLDLTYVTDRKGSPQSLVCTKTQATYERRCAQFENDLQLLQKLENFASPDVAKRPPSSIARPASRKKNPRPK